jgi:hypothetical protein
MNKHICKDCKRPTYDAILLRSIKCVCEEIDDFIEENKELMAMLAELEKKENER